MTPRIASKPVVAQSASAVLMIRPRHFASNTETVASNRFQEQDRRAGSTLDPTGARTTGDAQQAAAARVTEIEEQVGDAQVIEDAQAIAAAARSEFDALAKALAGAGVTVHALEGRDSPVCPDEVFPNNWLSTHADGTLVLYPMHAPNRRLERRDDVIERLRGLRYAVREIVDLTAFEQQGVFLEGTGSLVLDRRARLAYSCVSARTSPEAVTAFCERMDYEPVIFDAYDRHGHPIFHTNVLMSVGTEFAILCAEAIPKAQRQAVLGRLEGQGRCVIEIGYDQLHAFAGNLLELRGPQGAVIALSRRALASLDIRQREALGEHGQLVAVPVDTIERYGGGSVRCMLAEIHLPPHGA